MWNVFMVVVVVVAVMVLFERLQHVFADTSLFLPQH